MCTNHTFQLSEMPVTTTRRIISSLLSMILVATLMLGASDEAAAQACCTATSTGEFSVVGRCHQSVITSRLGFEPTVGSYDTDGRFRSAADASIYDAVWAVGAGSRLGTRRFQVYGSLPLRLQYRNFDEVDASTGLGLGDAGVGVRWTLLEDPMAGIDFGDTASWLPFFDLYVNASLPTGRSPEAGQHSMDADVTGAGIWSATAGVRLSKFVTRRWIIGAQGDMTIPTGRQVETRGESVHFRPGREAGASATLLHIPTVFWSWGLNAGMRWTGESAEAGQPITGSSARRLTLGAFVTRALDYPFWEATLAVSTDPWWDGPAYNLSFVGPAVTIGVQRNFM